MQGMMQGLINGMQNQEPPRPKTPEEIEQERQQELLRQKAEQERQQKIKDYQEAQDRAKKEKEDQLDREAQDSMALLGASSSPPSHKMTDEELMGSAARSKDQKSASYQKAFSQATECISRNAGIACADAKAATDTQACVADYNAGYEAGAKAVAQSLQDAFQAGETAGSKGELANGPADGRAAGGCRTQWIEAYNRGHFQGKNKSAK